MDFDNDSWLVKKIVDSNLLTCFTNRQQTVGLFLSTSLMLIDLPSPGAITSTVERAGTLGRTEGRYFLTNCGPQEEDRKQIHDSKSTKLGAK